MTDGTAPARHTTLDTHDKAANLAMLALAGVVATVLLVGAVLTNQNLGSTLGGIDESLAGPQVLVIASLLTAIGSVVAATAANQTRSTRFTKAMIALTVTCLGLYAPVGAFMFLLVFA